MDPQKDTSGPGLAHRSEVEQVPGASLQAAAATTPEVCSGSERIPAARRQPTPTPSGDRGDDRSGCEQISAASRETPLPPSGDRPENCSESERILAARRETPLISSGDRPENCSESERILAASRETPPTSSGDRPEDRSESERIPAATAEVLPGPDRFFDVADAELAEDILTVLDRLEIGTMHRIQALVPSLGLTVREFLVLTELSLRPAAGLTNGQVTGIVGLPSATVAELLTALEACGLVIRLDDPFDGRCIVSLAADEARQLLADARGRSWQIEDLKRELLRGLDVHQLEGVLRFLGRATDRAYRRSRQLRERPRRERVTRRGGG